MWDGEDNDCVRPDDVANRKIRRREVAEESPQGEGGCARPA